MSSVDPKKNSTPLSRAKAVEPPTQGWGRDESSQLPPEFAEIEAGLRSFQVADGRLDRERLMFELGRESAIGSPDVNTAAPARARDAKKTARTLSSVAAGSRFWPAATAASMLISVGLFVAVVARPERIVVVERIVATNGTLARQVTLPDQLRDDAETRDAMEQPAWRGGQYFAQRQIAVMQSVEALPSRPMGQAATTREANSLPLTAREMWKTLSEENQNSQSPPSSEPTWLRWLNPEAWL